MLASLLLAAPAWAQSDDVPDEDEGEVETRVVPEKHYARAALLEALAIGGGTAWYWLDRERQVADWDFPSWRDRFTLDVMRYDNNPFHVNFAWHAGNGASFHFFARANGLSFAEALGYGALTSILWEYALEYREKVSVNDLIFTTGSGLPLGEFIHVMGSYLNRDPDARQWTALRWTLGAPQALMNALDGDDMLVRAAPPGSHELRLGYDFSYSSIERQGVSEDFALHTWHMDGRFARLPGYHETGAWNRFFYAAEFTSARFDASVGGAGSGFKLFADTTLLGYYQQQFHKGAEFLSNSTMIGIAMAYRYRREEVGAWDDRVGVLHLPGLAADAHLRYGDFQLDLRGRANLDFAGVNALANTDWEAAHPNEQGKAILRKMGYYYGFGQSVSTQAEARYRSLSLGAQLWVGRYTSDEGLDRTQEDVTLDQKSRDTVVDGEVYLRLEGLPYRGYLGASYYYRGRYGVLEEFSADATMHRASLALGVSL